MIRVMIVDDMPIFREYLREAIDWSRYGFEICCEAKNGKEALEMVKAYEPDIVLSDITMPFMDGLEFTESLKALESTTEVVLITGNSEFEYARKAVKLGVADYIVKPFEKEELILTLLNLKDNIEKSIELEMEKQDEKYNQQEQLLKRLIYSKDVGDIQVEDYKKWDIALGCGRHYYVTVVELEANLKKIDQSEQAMNWKSAIGSLYKDYIEVKGIQYLFKDYEGRVVFLTCLADQADYSFDYDELDGLIELIKERLNFDITIGIGRLYPDLEGIRKSYLESLNALNNRFIDGSNRVINYNDITNNIKGYGFYSAELNEIIINHLNQLNCDETLKVLEDIFLESDDLMYNSEYKRMMSMGLISLLLSYVVKVGKNIKDIFPHRFEPYLIIRNESDAVQRQFILDAYEKVILYLDVHKESESSKIAKEAKVCIDENYGQDDFSMGSLTKKLLVNQTYLRKMFKSEYNMTISEYLVKVRMEHAKDLIVESYYKLSAISEMVGYKDPGYFSKSFKKYYGVSPREFHKNM